MEEVLLRESVEALTGTDQLCGLLPVPTDR